MGKWIPTSCRTFLTARVICRDSPPSDRQEIGPNRHQIRHHERPFRASQSVFRSASPSGIQVDMRSPNWKASFADSSTKSEEMSRYLACAILVGLVAAPRLALTYPMRTFDHDPVVHPNRILESAGTLHRGVLAVISVA